MLSRPIRFRRLHLGGSRAPPPQARIVDLKHYSTVFGEERNFRVLLPLGETIAIAVPDGDVFRAVELFSSDACVK